VNHQTVGEGAATRLTPEDLSALRANLREQRRFRQEQLRQIDSDSEFDAAPCPDGTSATEDAPSRTNSTLPSEDAPSRTNSTPSTEDAPSRAPGALPTETPADRSAAARDEVRVKLYASARMVLADVEAALARMAEGRYGTCLLCRRPIPRERLMIVPQARYCARCQQVREAGR
jgi:RNA polymerase-binding transcription factor DksA